MTGIPSPGEVSIAIDGPAGSGKSSAAREVARRLGLEYIDTGAMYRAMTWWFVDRGVDIDDATAVAAHADDPIIQMTFDVDHPVVTVDGNDVTAAIRLQEVSDAVSRVSAVPEIRARMVSAQRECVAAARRRGRGVVMEGRDIGTVVMPDASAKIFLTADVAVRAARRALEDRDRLGVVDAGYAVPDHLRQAMRNLESRDALDSSREVSPLVKAEDAVEIDATHLTLDEVVDAIIDVVADGE